MQRAGEIASKAQKLKTEYWRKGVFISFQEAVNRVSGDFIARYENYLVNAAMEYKYKKEELGELITDEQAINAIRNLDDIEKIRAAISELETLSGEDFEKATSEILQSMKKVKSGLEEVKKINELKTELKKLISEITGIKVWKLSNLFTEHSFKIECKREFVQKLMCFASNSINKEAEELNSYEEIKTAINNLYFLSGEGLLNGITIIKEALKTNSVNFNQYEFSEKKAGLKKTLQFLLKTGGNKDEEGHISELIRRLEQLGY